jgi:hypothetical protein
VAGKIGLPRFSYFLDSKAKWPDADCDQGEPQIRLERFNMQLSPHFLFEVRVSVRIIGQRQYSSSFESTINIVQASTQGEKQDQPFQLSFSTSTGTTFNEVLVPFSVRTL